MKNAERDGLPLVTDETMSDSEAETILLSLLQTSLCGTVSDYHPATDWNRVFEAAKKQTVVTLAERGLPGTLSKELLSEWSQASNFQIANYVRYLNAQDYLCGVFKRNNIPMAIVKGAAAAYYYPKPHLRMMGDIDFIIPKAYLAQAKRIMLDAGFQHKSSGGRHIAYRKDGFVFEMHYYFSYSDLDIEEQISDGFQNLVQVQLDGYTFPMFPKRVNGLILLAHIREHLRCGLGLRPVIDWRMFAEHELNDEVWKNEFSVLAKKKKLDTFAIILTRLCQMYLGLPETVTWCADGDEELCRQLMKSLLSVGNFGNRQKVETLISGVVTNIRKERLFPYLQRIGERDWKLCHKHRWLKPFAWLREIWVFARKAVKLKLNGKKVVSSLVYNKEHYDLLKKLNLL